MILVAILQCSNISTLFDVFVHPASQFPKEWHTTITFYGGWYDYPRCIRIVNFVRRRIYSDPIVRYPREVIVNGKKSVGLVKNLHFSSSCHLNHTLEVPVVRFYSLCSFQWDSPLPLSLHSIQKCAIKYFCHYSSGTSECVNSINTLLVFSSKYMEHLE